MELVYNIFFRYIFYYGHVPIVVTNNAFFSALMYNQTLYSPQLNASFDNPVSFPVFIRRPK